MPLEIILPKVDMDMSHARLVRWLARPGERVTQGQVLFEIETDKSTMEIEAEADGTLGFLSGEAGSDIEIGRTIGWLFREHEDRTVDPTQGGRDAGRTPPVGSVHDGSVRASPLARSIARQRQVPLTSLQGSGPQGRIVASDVGSPPTSGVASAGGLFYRDGIAYRQWGDPSGPLRLLLHGFAGDSATWSALAGQLADRGQNVIAPDLPGHGASERQADTPAALSDALAAFIEQAPVEPARHVVAHSMGALPAMQLAALPGVASLTLLAPIGMGAHIDRDFLSGMARPAGPAALRHQLRKLGEGGHSLSAAALDTLHRQLTRGRLEGLARCLAGDAGQNVDIVADLHELAARLPCRVVVGHLDRIVDWRDACRLGLRVAVHHLPAAGHMPQWDAPASLCELLLSTG